MQLDYKLSSVLKEVAKLGAQEALIQAKIIPSHITKSKAYKLYGRSTVEKWIKAGAIQCYQDDSSSKCMLSATDLAAVATSQSLIQYINLHQKP